MKTNKLLLITFILLSLNSNAQSQVGNTVYNSSNDENFGAAVSINAQGNIVAIGANETDTANGDASGLVRVFELNNASNQWEQKGNDIIGDNTADLLGTSVSLNSTGNILAVGAPNSSSDGFQSGLVKVFEFNNSNNQWEQKGNDIFDGLSDYFTGNSVSLNSLGTRIAIGTPASPTGFHLGNIVVFDYDSNINDWVQVGSTTIGTQNYVNLGYSVALNNSGDTFIAGGPALYRNVSDPINGMIKVYQLVNNNWVQKGSDIVASQADDFFGGTVDINNDGNIIIIGAIRNDENGNNAGKADIFEYDGLNWIEKGASILGEAEDQLGKVKINDVGDKILTGSSRYNNNLGKVELFKFTNNNWEQTGSSIIGDTTDDNFGSDTSMTSDGNYVVSGTRRSDDINSYFKVYETSSQTLNLNEQAKYNLNLFFEENTLIIKFNNLEINNVNVYNTLGQIIKLDIKKSNFLKIRFIDSLETGVYYVKLSTDKGVLSNKILYKKAN